MTDPIAFLLAVFALLSAPGPSNTLLATSGAAVGFRRSLALVPAEMAGYALSISMLALAVGPLVRGWPLMGFGLRLACGAYLASLAWRLWSTGGGKLVLSGPVSFTQMFTASLLNPKGLVFAFGILPHLAYGRAPESLPYCASLLGMMALLGMFWSGLGALAKRGLGPTLDARVVHRIGATTILGFAFAVSGSAFTTLVA